MHFPLRHHDYSAAFFKVKDVQAPGSTRRYGVAYTRDFFFFNVSILCLFKNGPSTAVRRAGIS